MQDPQLPTANQPAYLKELQAKERKRKLKSLGLGLGVLALVGSSVVILLNTSTSVQAAEASAFQQFGMRDLNDKVAQAFFEETGNIMVVNHEEGTQDTIRSYQEYHGLINQYIDVEEMSVSIVPKTMLLDSATLDNLLPDSLQEIENATLEGENALPAFNLKVVGEQEVGKYVYIQIENFTPGYSYKLDLGNGRQQVGRKINRVSYKVAGTYSVALLVKGPEMEEEIVDVYAVRIANAPEPEEEETNELAGDTPNPDTIAPTAPTLNPVRSLSTLRNTGASSTPEMSLDAPETANQIPNNRIDFSRPLYSADQMPQFPGGSGAMNRFISNNVRYPEGELEGSVMIRFIVDREGNIQEPQILKSLGPEYDQEVLRILKVMPKWKPGIQGGVNVSVYTGFAVRFQKF